MKRVMAILAGAMLLFPVQAEVLKTAPVCNVPADLPPAPDIVESNSARTLAWLGPIYVEIEKRLPGPAAAGERLRIGVTVNPVTGEAGALEQPNLRRDPALDTCD
jgi:hypothetical protein